MKLLNCQKCHDVVALHLGGERKCLCGASKGKYVTQTEVNYYGPARILGLKNSDYREARPGRDYTWFIIPEGRSVHKIN